jgi:hypothetical protein
MMDVNSGDTGNGGGVLGYRANRLAELKSSFEPSSLHHQAVPIKRPTRDAVPRIASLFQINQGSRSSNSPDLHQEIIIQHSRSFPTAAPAGGKEEKENSGPVERQSLPTTIGVAVSEQDRRKSFPHTEATKSGSVEDHVVRFQHAKEFFQRKEEANRGLTGG